MIAALFVDSDGCYIDVPGVDAWPVERDARNYAGDNPIIAHPPCKLWTKLARVNFARYGGEHNRPGNDGGCFAFALATVEKCGGVIEHPATSYAWRDHGLDVPHIRGWVPSRKGYVCEVWQSAYGHRASKATWLYYVGNSKPFALNWDRPRGEFQVGWTDTAEGRVNKPTLSARESRATPVLFRDELIALAKHSANAASANAKLARREVPK
jgi:hypothetical protein